VSEEQFTQAEVDAFASKLDEWGGTLPDRERRMLHALLAEAQTAEVEGFNFGSFQTMGTQPPTLDKLAGSALRPIVQMENPWQLRAYDRWDPTE
jgi:hypothetical protein